MDASRLLYQGLELMLVGMGTVFLFLAVLVLMMSLLARLVAMVPEQPGPTAAGDAGAEARPSTGSDGELMAVFAAALKAHRSRRR